MRTCARLKSEYCDLVSQKSVVRILPILSSKKLLCYELTRYQGDSLAAMWRLHRQSVILAFLALISVCSLLPRPSEAGRIKSSSKSDPDSDLIPIPDHLLDSYNTGKIHDLPVGCNLMPRQRKHLWKSIASNQNAIGNNELWLLFCVHAYLGPVPLYTLHIFCIWSVIFGRKLLLLKIAQDDGFRVDCSV